MLSFFSGSLLILYPLTSFIYTFLFIGQTDLLNRVAGVSLFLLLVVHVSVFYLNFEQMGYIPVANIFQAISSIALAMILIYFLIEFLTKIKTTGFIFIYIAFLLQLIYEIFSGVKPTQDKGSFFHDPFFAWHTGLAITSYAAFIIGAVYGALYLALFRSLKMKKFGRIFRRMPSLEELDEMNAKSCLIGWGLLVLAVLIGYVWKKNLYGYFFLFDVKVLISLLLCILYAFQLLAYLKLNWSGKRRSYLSLLGFLILVFSMVVGNTGTHFHKFF